ncbi:hypothetical protein ABFX02_04G046600 [Erythranthe guttata]
MQSDNPRPGGALISGRPMSILSIEEENDDNYMVISSEESSSYPDSELELGLALSLGGGGKGKSKPPPTAAEAAGGGVYWERYARILTAEDFRSVVSTKAPSSSSSSSSSTVTKANNNNSTNGCCGTKRTAESPTSPPGRSPISQVVGWPPVRTYRMNSLANAKSPITEDFFSATDKCKSNNVITSLDNKTNNGGIVTDNSTANEKVFVKKSLFVKVNMDGIPIGRKVDLNAHSCYQTLARSLDEMFRPSVSLLAKRSSVEETLRLLDGLSEFVLTYEDKDGDWMLVGDVPWQLFLISVRRLRIMKKTEANGLGPGSHEKNRRQLTVHI